MPPTVLPTVSPTAPSAEIEKSDQDPSDWQVVICLLTSVKDTTNSVTDSVTDSVHHAASGIGDTPNKTSLRPKISITFEVLQL